MTTPEHGNSAMLQIGIELGLLRARVEQLTRAKDALITPLPQCIPILQTSPTTTSTPTPSSPKASLVDRLITMAGHHVIQDLLKSLAMRILKWVWRYVVPLVGMALQFVPGLGRWVLEHVGHLGCLFGSAASASPRSAGREPRSCGAYSSAPARSR